MKRDAIEYYHGLLTEKTAAETQELFNSLMGQRRLYFGDRPLCTVLRPHFYTEDQYAYLKRETETILGAFAKTHQACLNDANLRKQFWLEPWEEEMFLADGESPIPWPTSRLDSFFSHDHGRVQFIEYNSETSAGRGDEGVLD